MKKQPDTHIPAVKRHGTFSLPLLMLSFGAASGLFGATTSLAQETPQPQTITQPVPGHSFWKHPEYDAVLEVWEADGGLKGKIASLNPRDPKVREMVGKILKKELKQVSDKDVLFFKGMEGDLHLHKDGDNKWTGSIYWPFKQKAYGVDVEEKPGILHVRGFFLMLPFIGKSADLTPVTMPKPRPPTTS